ncbi:hypothetical protein [Caenibius sp. WL]|uniref:hypothetical protein n=1 Tax=Caenibius sp. WL TaxID=2872646 RepID=UPI001C993C63|nr:hypothetical protein [Caenibius sp. WL]QZP06835.1 hypothetical protein K5X80_08845 [Caenibius sp. WL]
MQTNTANPPILLSKIDALSFAAQQLDEMVMRIGVASQMLDLIESIAAQAPGKSDEASKLLDLRSKIPEPEIQRRAIGDAAKAIRDLVLEERLIAAHAMSTL